MPLSIGQTALLPDGHTAYPGTGTPRDLTNLFPFASGYTMWAGSCLDADPEGVGGTGAFPGRDTGRGRQRHDLGAVPTEQVAMAKIKVVVISDSTGDPVEDASVSATHAGSAVCDFPESYALGTTDDDGALKVSLPWGTWDFQVAGYTVVYAVTPTFPPDSNPYYVEVRVP